MFPVRWPKGRIDGEPWPPAASIGMSPLVNVSVIAIVARKMIAEINRGCAHCRLDHSSFDCDRLETDGNLQCSACKIVGQNSQAFAIH